ncbi:hypothetical protein BR63_03000 [Thermanaerosceptrum fracticalcis]|uniref:Uncharacterized protein n=1 Tax=Thermanaerosceptrum fracticalcis TaxID=1712410 RepID=A0A7G6DZW4_THEFR|nr:hypothetical protein [Thermanaerosceptrum fracticalcis]QNB45368.1 hypothetical protein BR63_03000 [Thermanaerosceptrum fracticalcis]
MRLNKKAVLLLVIMLIFTLSAPVWANEQQNKKFSEILSKKDGIGEIKPLDFDKLGDKVMSLGDKIFEFLQKGSVPLLAIGMGIAVVSLFIGIFVGKAIKTGIWGIVISFAVYYLINYMPETVMTIKQTVIGFFK